MAIAFGSDSNLREVLTIKPKTVYFKTKGIAELRFRAELIDISEENPRSSRLAGSEDSKWKFYYTFRTLQKIEPIPLGDLTYYATRRSLRNDIPNACLIIDPLGVQ